MGNNPNSDAAINIDVSADSSDLTKLNKEMDTTQKVSKSMRDTLAVLASAADKTGLSFSKSAQILSKEVTKSIQDEEKALRQSIITLKDKDNMLKQVIYTEQRLVAMRDKSSGKTIYGLGNAATLKSSQEMYQAMPGAFSKPKYTYQPYMDGGLTVKQTPFLNKTSQAAQLGYNAPAIQQQMLQYQITSMLGNMSMDADAVAAARPRGYDRNLTQQRWNTRNALNSDAWRRTQMDGETVSSRNYTAGSIGYASGSKSQLIPPEFANGKFKAAFVESKDAATGFAAEFGKINFTALAARALVVIPTWFVLRNALMAVGSIIPNTVARFKELDQAVADMATQTSGIGNMAAFSDKAKNAIQNLARETGSSVADISAAYRAFSETGASVETSLAGMNVAIKGGIGSMTDSKDLAASLVTIYRLFGDSITEASTAGDKMQYIMGVLNKLFKDNTGKMTEYMASIKNFAGVASSWGIGMKPMLAMIVTLHDYAQKAGIAGTELSSSFREVTKNSKAVGQFLGKELRGSDVDSYEVFIAVLEKLKAIQDGKIKGNMQEEILKMFDARALKGVAAMVDGLDMFKKNMQGISSANFKLGDAIGLNDDQFQTRMNTINQQLERTKAIAADVGISFASALMGIKSDDPVKALKALNVELTKMLKSSKEFGQEIHDLATNPGIQLLLAAFAGNWAKGKIAGALAGASFAPGAGTVIGGTVLATEALKAGANKVNDEHWGTKLRSWWEDLWKPEVTHFKEFYKAPDSSASKSAWAEYYKKQYSDSNTYKDKQSGMVFDVNRATIDHVLNRPAEEAKNRDDAQAYMDAWKKKNEANKTTKKQSLADADTKSLEQQLMALDRMKIYGWNDIQIQTAKLEILKKQGKEAEGLLELQKMQNQEAIAYAETIKSSLSGSFENMLSGKGSVKDVFKNLGNTAMDSTRKNLADGMSNMVMATGLGDMFGGAMSSLKNSMASMTERITIAHDDGGKKVYDWITKGFSEGTSSSRSSGSAGVAGYSGQGGSVGGAIAGRGGWVSQSNWGNQPFLGGGAMQSNGPQTTSQGIKVPSTTKASGFTNSQVGGMALVGMSTYQGQRNAGASKAGSAMTAVGSIGIAAGMAGAFAAGTATTAAGALAFLGPVGWILAIGLLIAGMFMSSKAKSVSQQSQTTDNRISSKIDVTNQNLEVINRNLVDLKTAVTTYVLPTSVYFSSKRNIEDEFSLSMRRGLASV